MVNEYSIITEEMLKDCDANFLEGSLDGVENTPPVEATNDSMTDDYFQMLDEIKFLKTKLSEKDRAINFLKQDLDRTLDEVEFKFYTHDSVFVEYFSSLRFS